jgi:hypothetical protein
MPQAVPAPARHRRMWARVTSALRCAAGPCRSA